MTEKLPYSTECEKPPPYTDLNSAQSSEETEKTPEKSIDTLGMKKKEGDPELGGDSIKKLGYDKEIATSLAVRGLLVHLIFLSILCVIIYPVNWLAARGFTNSINKLFTRTTAPSGKHFAEIDEIDDIWEYMNNQLVEGLYWDPLAKNHSDISYRNYQSDKAKFNHSRLLGQPKIRMLKIIPSACTPLDRLQSDLKPCYSNYWEMEEDLESFNPVGVNSPAFNYTSAAELGTCYLRGALATYGGGGFVQYLSEKNMKESLESIAFLKENGWIDRASRMVVIEFGVYYGRLNVFSFVKLIFELPRAGGVIPTIEINTLRLLRYVNVYDQLVLMCEASFCYISVLMFFYELSVIFRYRSTYFKTFWKYINLAIIGLSFVCIKLALHRTSLVHDRVHEVLEEKANSYSFDDVVLAETTYNYCTTLLLIFAVFKTVKYIRAIANGLSARAKRIGLASTLCLMFLISNFLFGYILFTCLILNHRAHLVKS